MKLRIVMLMFLLVVQPSLAQSPIDGVQALYQWYLESPATTGDRLSATNPFMQSELSDLLKRAYDSKTLDFDPFVNSKVPARTFAFNDMKRKGTQATVTVQPVFDSGVGPEFDVLLIKKGERWLVVDLKFPELALKSHLRKTLGSKPNPSPSPRTPLVSPSPKPSPTTPKPKAPVAGLSEAALLGTWLHMSTSDTLGGEQTPVAPVEIKWTFKAGGHGEFSQKISVTGDPWIGPLDWSLEGQTIMIGGGRNRYTVVRPGKDGMVWKNEGRGNYYWVRRIHQQ
jgi:hypothetical protein